MLLFIQKSAFRRRRSALIAVISGEFQTEMNGNFIAETAQNAQTEWFPFTTLSIKGPFIA